MRDEYSETDLEEALGRHLEAFVLELGNDFAFVGRQRRLREQDCVVGFRSARSDGDALGDKEHSKDRMIPPAREIWTIGAAQA